jgi:hypothetical protein
MQWELCERRGGDKCPHYDSCRARAGVEGPADARIAVGPHALLGQLNAHAGTSGLLIIDEIQDFLETALVTTDDLDFALQQGPQMLDGRFVAALEPSVRALRAFLDEAPLDEAVDATMAVRRHARAVAPELIAQARRSAAVDGDLVECARAAPFPEGHNGQAPPLLRHIVELALLSRPRARSVGRASSVLRLFHHAIKTEVPVVVRVELRRGRRVLLVTSARETLAHALRREGSVVVLDANVDLHAPVLARVVGYEPPLHVFTAPDGAPIARTLQRCKRANRKAWSDDNGHLSPTAALLTSVRQAVTWLAEAPSVASVGLITFHVLETALRYTVGIERDDARRQWVEAHYDPGRLDELSEALGPIVAGFGGEWLFGHYGATRGLNTMAGADALITLGDPWRNLGDAHNDAAFLHLEGWKARYEAWCRAELEQAHGRLRTVHRTRPARALHVGAIMPGGSGWSVDRVDVRMDVGGRPRREAAMPTDALEQAIELAGGVSRLAEHLGSRGLPSISGAVADRSRTTVLVAEAYRRSSPKASGPSSPRHAGSRTHTV